MEQKRNKQKGKGLIRRILLIGLFVVIGLLVIFVGINVFVSNRAISFIVSKEDELPKPADAIIVLGAGLTTDNEPGPILQDRLDTAIRLYKEGYSDRLLMSGDHGDEYHNEVKAMKDYAIKQGVPEDDIFMDHAGFNTYDTMVRARRVFQVSTCIIVTQTYHLFRSIYVARSVGLDAWGYASDIHINQWKYVPLEFREFFARIKDFLWLIFQPDPTLLGDPIPIEGNGAATDD